VALTIIGGFRAVRSKNWPVTQATVVAFRATPNYQYTVAGNTYTNDNVSCNELFGWSKELTDSEKYAVRYPLSAKVTIHYQPGKPDIAVLETKFDSGVFWKQLGLLSLATLMLAFVTLFGARLR
jgi:hypothetical protein